MRSKYFVGVLWSQQEEVLYGGHWKDKTLYLRRVQWREDRRGNGRVVVAEAVVSVGQGTFHSPAVFQTGMEVGR